jgi:hypothetical protein
MRRDGTLAQKRKSVFDIDCAHLAAECIRTLRCEPIAGKH